MASISTQGPVIQRQAGVRSRPLNAPTIAMLSAAADAAGVYFRSFSGGQSAQHTWATKGKTWTGSHRHDEGEGVRAADGFLVDRQTGRQLSYDNPQDLPVFQKFIQSAVANGATGIGAGEDYMQPGSIHVGGGAHPKSGVQVWGAGGKGANAPQWLRQSVAGLVPGKPASVSVATAGQAAAPPGQSIEAYVRQSAIARGIDPDVAVRVVKSEGGLSDPTQQSYVKNNGVRETSYGPFQLRIGGGLGDAALKAGIDPRKPEDWQRGVDFALNHAVENGWGDWFGAAKAGLGNFAGITRDSKPRAVGMAYVPSDLTPALQAATAMATGQDIPAVVGEMRSRAIGPFTADMPPIAPPATIATAPPKPMTTAALAGEYAKRADQPEYDIGPTIKRVSREASGDPLAVTKDPLQAVTYQGGPMAGATMANTPPPTVKPSGGLSESMSYAMSDVPDVAGADDMPIAPPMSLMPADAPVVAPPKAAAPASPSMATTSPSYMSGKGRLGRVYNAIAQPIRPGSANFWMGPMNQPTLYLPGGGINPSGGASMPWAANTGTRMDVHGNRVSVGTYTDTNGNQHTYEMG